MISRTRESVNIVTIKIVRYYLLSRPLWLLLCITITYSAKGHELTKELMISTSGIRGVVGSSLEPVMITKYAAAFGTYLGKGTVIVGRDSRPSGELFKMAVIAGLRSVGMNVIDLDIVPTPTVEIAVTGLRAAGGICITASHNASQWNALKFFNKRGEFIDESDLAHLRKNYDKNRLAFKDHNRLGKYSQDATWIARHIEQVLKLKSVNRGRIKRRRFKIVVDAINGAGSEALPRMLELLGAKVILLNCKGDGDFVHNPEPTPANLKSLSYMVKKHGADLGLACDPDADRLALVDDKGQAVSEELTLALAVKHILSRKKGNVVVNLSTSRITEYIAEEAGCRTHYTPVGEANVIAGLKKHRAVIGGEGNGGVIYPAFHSGRDSLVGAALILGLLVESENSLSEIVRSLPKYHNIKSKAPLPSGYESKLLKVENLAKSSFENLKIDRRDGLRFDFSRGWFQIRKSNTEPIYRLITETDSQELTELIQMEITNLLK